MTRTFKLSYLICFPILLCVFVVGCATTSKQDNGSRECAGLSSQLSGDLNAYSLYVSSTGSLYDVNKNTVTDKNLYLENILANLNRALNAEPRTRLSLFIHGGLNNSREVSERVKDLKDRMLADCKYPLFISWRSGFWGNYGDHLLFLRRGEYTSTGDSESPLDKALTFIRGPVAAPFVLMEDVLRATARFPASTYHILVEQNIVRRGLVDDSPDETDIAKKTLAEGIHLHLPGDGDQNLGIKELWSVTNPIKLVTASFEDSVGSGAWNSMLRRADLVLTGERTVDINRSKPEAFPDSAKAESCEIRIKGNESAVAEFFRIWECRYRDRPVEMIGHSMGTIIGSKIIAQYPDIHFSSIVFMAAACSLNDVAEIVSPYLHHHPDSVFYNLTLHPKRDQFENVSYVDIVPRGSLLWWLDNTMATINSFEDRSAGYWPNMYKVAPEIFPPKIQPRVHLTKFGMGDDVPKTHGSFDNFPFWRQTFWEGNP